MLHIALTFIEAIGAKTINALSSFYNLIAFATLCLMHMIYPLSYTQKMRTSLVKQVYHTSITIAPIYSIIAFVFGSVIIGIFISLATKFNLQLQLGSLIVNFVVNEFSPIFTALFIALRSGTLINKKLSLVNLNDEENFIDTLVLPRLISGMLSTLSLSILLSLIMLISGYIFIFFYMGMDLHTYKQLLYDAFNISNVITLFFKSLALGFIVMLIPIYNGIQIAQNKLSQKISLIHTLIKLFFAIFFIEVLSLLFLALLSLAPRI